MFTATWVQTATYLFAVCPFSISFLVFMNSSVSFVITDLIGLESGEGDAAGTLGFADELLALVACPLWGIISDRIGVRYVCSAGYAIVALSLVVFVQARNVYPQLLLGRLLFCVGGSAVATMVTAVLPTVTAPEKDRSNSNSLSTADGDDSAPTHGRQQSTSTSLASERTITPSTLQTQPQEPLPKAKDRPQGSPSRLAGFVGTLTGCGALLALFVFLPLPAHFEKGGQSPAQSIKSSYYVVAAVSIAVSMVCFLGLRHLQDDRGKSLKSLFRPDNSRNPEDTGGRTPSSYYLAPKSYLGQINAAFLAGFKHIDIGLGYIGGLVARASSVGISLFIPLYVNQYYRSSGLCHQENSGSTLNPLSDSNLGDIKQSCPRAYTVAAILTGVSQLVALLTAPGFGFLSSWVRFCNFPLLGAAVSGIVGYVMLALLPSPQIGGEHGTPAIFIDMAFIGISQIGAIVCSLAVLGDGVLAIGHRCSRTDDSNRQNNADGTGDDEYSSLLPKSKTTASDNLTHLKGSIAGMYSLFGGAGILILTKLGGYLFDKVSPTSPFYILAVFNGLLLVFGLMHGIRQQWKAKTKSRNTE